MPSATSTEFVRVIRIKNANGTEKLLEIPAKLDLDRPKRPRTVFTDEQLEKLESAFNNSGYLSGGTRAKLAESLGLSDNQVKVWFQNRRTKQKKLEASTETAKEPAKQSLDTSKSFGDYQSFYQNYWSAAFLSNNAVSS